MTANWRTRGGELLHVETTAGFEAAVELVAEQGQTWLGWTPTCERCREIGTVECNRERNG